MVDLDMAVALAVASYLGYNFLALKQGIAANRKALAREQIELFRG